MKIRISIVIKVLIASVVLALLVKTFVVTSCTIPFTGMENSLYQGERVLVNKWSYGFRIPFTSSHFLADKVERGDIVLFNNPVPASVEAPVFLRELYISRCIGVPGDTLMLNDELMAVGEKAQSPDSKSLYTYPYTEEETMKEALKQVGIQNNTLVGYKDGKYLRSFSNYEYYLLNQYLNGKPELKALADADSLSVRPFVIPERNKPIQVYPWNVKLLCNTILYHEGRKAEVKNDSLFVDGKPVNQYVFRKNYYWMFSNNPVNLTDSRLFGLVPHDHVVGRAAYIWYSPQTNRIFKPVQ